MPEYVTLLGTEEVSRASNNMRSAADEMNRAASSIDSALFNFLQRFSEQVDRLVALQEESNDG